MNLLKKIDRSDWMIIGVYSFLLVNLLFWGEWLEEDWSFWSKDTLYLFFNISVVEVLKQMILVVLIVFYIVPRFFNEKRYAMTLSLIVLLLLLARIIDPYILPYTSAPLQPDLAANLFWGVLEHGEAISFPCFLLLAKSFYQSQVEVLALQKEQKETELRVLQAQVDPHFLFNNLNILDILIGQDPQKARIFTRKLSALYRYMIRHKDDEFVSLPTEWKFCENYIYLIGQRFNGLFPFENQIDQEEMAKFLVPPAAIQTLLENITKHNAALPAQPVKTKITLTNDYLVISNDFRPKNKVKDSTGTGLLNLASRIALLTDKKLEHQIENDQFVVRLPLVKQIS
ncbi:MAG: histidine kinase [Bacteroidota bacterium]